MRTLVVTLTMCLFAASTVQAKYRGGSGTANDPYQIATAADLSALGETPGDCDKHFILTADIDLSGHSYDTALIAPDTDPCDPAFTGTPFTGVLDGNGHAISNMTIHGTSYLGLFGRTALGSAVERLRLEQASVKGMDYVGGLAGSNSAGATVTATFWDTQTSGHEGDLLYRE